MTLLQLCTISLALMISALSQPLHAGNVDATVAAEVSLGERLFLETRFAQTYAAHPGKADPVLRYSITTAGKFNGPFAGKNMNCRACHMVDEHQNAKHGGMRTYTDFARMSPIPDRHDGRHVTGRNSMSLVNIMRIPGALFHFDGEFNSMEDLVRATLTGRNYGWQTDENTQAIAHIAQVIRTDDGKDELAKEFGGSYRNILAGTDPAIADEFRLPEKYRIDVTHASDTAILDAVARLITAYIEDLGFSVDDTGNYNGSPYDRFLELNHLPRRPAVNETDILYAQRLANAVNNLTKPKYVFANIRRFTTHQQPFEFGATELKGLKLFLASGSSIKRGGNCASCHTPPHFTDGGFHNTGVTQSIYDKTHGTGSFMKQVIPDLATRRKNYNAYLPATAKHPHASEHFRRPVSQDNPEYVDLGAWNIYANPDMPAPQEKLNNIFCRQQSSAKTDCSAASLLPTTIAAFKTPSLRNPGHSGPYMHTGLLNTLAEVTRFYISSSHLAKSGQLRNADQGLFFMNLKTADLPAIEAFLKSLNEDYD